MAMLNKLHNLEHVTFVYTCNNCEKRVKTRYHCPACVCFNFCIDCCNEDNHQRGIDKLLSSMYDDSATGDQKQTNPQESGLLSIQRLNKYLVNANKCRDANCRLYSCQNMKRVLQHTKSCKQKSECSICKQFATLWCYHAKHCQEAKCSVPFCANLKIKLRQKQLEQRLQQAETLKASVVTMQNRGISNVVLQPSSGNSNSSSKPSLSAQSCTSPHPPQPGIGTKSSSGPPVGALQAVQQVQAAAVRETLSHMVASNYSKGNPLVNPAAASTGLMPPNQQMQAQMKKPMLTMMSSVPNHMLNMGNVPSWENSGYAQNPQPHSNTQSNPQLGLWQTSQIMGGSNTIPNSVGNSTMGPSEIIPNPGPSTAGMQRPTQA